MSAQSRTRLAAPSWKVAVALGLVYVFWGSTYLAIRVALDDLPPFTIIASRFVIAGGLLLGFTVVRGTAVRPSRADLGRDATVGILLLGAGTGGVALAEQHLPTGVVALVVATTPLWIALLARALLGDRLRRISVISLLIGFAGVALLASPGGGSSPLAIGLTLLTPFAWSLGSVVARRSAAPRDALQSAALQMLIAGLVMAAVAVAVGEPARIHGVTAHAALAIAYLVTFGSFVGYTAYTWLLRAAPLPLTATYAYVNPFVALLLGAAFRGEAITARVLIGGGVIALAVAILVSAPSLGRRARTPAGGETRAAA